MSARERWLLRSSSGTQAITERLVCIPFAGGGASVFRSWSSAAPPGLEICRVQLPGREDRANEPLCTSMPEVVETLADLLRDGTPTLIFGHSLGGLIGFELSAALAARGSAPRRFFASACRPPHVPDPYQLHRLPEAAFSGALRERGGTAPEILAHPELREFLLPLLRADLELAEAWQRSEPLRIAVPITVCAAPADAVIPWAVTSEWESYTSAGWERRAFPGDHFFVRDNPLAVLDFVLSRR